MRIEIKTGFLTQAQCDELNAWSDAGVSSGLFVEGLEADGSPEPLRLTTRLTTPTYPQSIYDLNATVRAYCGVTSYDSTEEGSQGIVSTYIKPGGDLYAHTDPMYGELSVLRCNIVTRVADSGGQLTVGGQALQLNAGDLHCFLASNYEHSVSEVYGSTARVLWSFDALVPAADWENGAIIFGA